MASQFKALRNKGNVEDQGIKNRWQCMADSRLVNAVYLISLTRINDTFRLFGLFLVSFWYFQSKTLFLTLLMLFASFIETKNIYLCKLNFLWSLYELFIFLTNVKIFAKRKIQLWWKIWLLRESNLTSYTEVRMIWVKHT